MQKDFPGLSSLPLCVLSVFLSFLTTANVRFSKCDNRVTNVLTTRPDALLPRLLDLRCPPLNAFALAAGVHLEFHSVHAFCIIQEPMTGHSSCIRPLNRQEFEHGQQELGDTLSLLDAEVILLAKDVGESPMPETVDVAELAFAIEDFLGPLAGDT